MYNMFTGGRLAPAKENPMSTPSAPYYDTTNSEGLRTTLAGTGRFAKARSGFKEEIVRLEITNAATGEVLHASEKCYSNPAGPFTAANKALRDLGTARTVCGHARAGAR